MGLALRQQFMRTQATADRAMRRDISAARPAPDARSTTATLTTPRLDRAVMDDECNMTAKTMLQGLETTAVRTLYRCWDDVDAQEVFQIATPPHRRFPSTGHPREQPHTRHAVGPTRPTFPKHRRHHNIDWCNTATAMPSERQPPPQDNAKTPHAHRAPTASGAGARSGAHAPTGVTSAPGVRSSNDVLSPNDVDPTICDDARPCRATTVELTTKGSTKTAHQDIADTSTS